MNHIKIIFTRFNLKFEVGKKSEFNNNAKEFTHNLNIIFLYLIFLSSTQTQR
jgi:hypothetical protein